MVLSLFIFIFGIVMLLISTHFFIKLAEKVSSSLRLSPLIIGLTIVSIGTSLPELTVSGIAIFRADTGLAMGNIIGSNIINVFLVFAVGILTGKLHVGTTKTQKSSTVLLGVIGLFLFLYFLRIPPVAAGIILIVTSFFVTIGQYIWGVNGRDHEDAKMYLKKMKTRISLSEVGILFATLVGIVIGGICTVTSVETLSRILGLSTTILGLSITAIATSMPELLTTLFSQRDHEDKITIGNIIGSNIYNVSLIGGIIVLFSSWSTITAYEVGMLILATLTMASIISVNNGKVIPKYIGILLLLVCIVYIYFLGY